MALDQRKRQKNAEKRKAKQQVRHQILAARSRDPIAQIMERAASRPILHSQYDSELWRAGIGQVTISRGVVGEDIVYAIFLLDVYCLGVKDVILGASSWMNYQDKIVRGLFQRRTHSEDTPAAIRKLVEGAVEFADQYGIRPHVDYQKARLIFGDIDMADCADEFVYGRKGRPLFIPGPYDSPLRIIQIMELLAKRVDDEVDLNDLVEMPAELGSIHIEYE